MTACVEVVNGRYAGSTRLLEPGDVCRVGSRAGSDLWLADDALVEPVHCAVTLAPNGLRLHDLSAGGTFVNGERATPDGARHGDWLVAGLSLLRCLERGQTDDAIDTVTTRLSAHLGSCWFLGEAPLTTLAGRLLAELADDWVPIGTAGVVLASLTATSPDVRWLVRAVWGHGRGCFLRADTDLDTLAPHFEAVAQRTAGFRFFDPRILRVLLPECSAPQWRELFGAEVGEVIVESQLPHSALAFRPWAAGVAAEMRRFAAYRAPIPRQSEIARALAVSASPDVAYVGLARSLGVTPAPLDAGAADWYRHRLVGDDARVQHELLRAVLGGDVLRPQMAALLSRATGSDAALDEYVATLNERRG